MSTTPRTPRSPILTTGSVSSEVSLLFRTKRVSEIRKYESRIREEADEKSESLRDLLGTRYKDLLEAADQMAAIHEQSVSNVRDSLRDMTQTATSLRERLLRKGDRAANPVSVNDDLERRRGVHVVGSKLKHIVDSPEVLYACLESGEIYEAAVRYAKAACNYREVTSTSGLEGVANRFAERRWKQVEVFKKQILGAAEKKLVSPALDPQVYARVLASLIVLTGADRDIVAILDGMLASRIIWIDDQNSLAEKTAAKKMGGIAQIVRETITCLHSMFWSADEGIEMLLKGVADDAIEQIDKLKQDGRLIATCVSWTRNVKGWLEEHGGAILDGAKTSRALVDTLRAIDDVFNVDEWETHCRAVLKQDTAFVFDIFKPFISDRAGVVASECVEGAVDKVLSDIDVIWSDISVGSHIGKLIWDTVSSQAVRLEEEDKDDQSEDSLTEEADVARVLGCNSQVSAVVGTFETSLQEALTDVTALTQRIPSVSGAFNSSVKSFLPRILERFKKRLDSLDAAEAGMGDSVQAGMERALFVARATIALGTADRVQSAYCFCEPESGISAKKSIALAEFREISDSLSSSAYRKWANRLLIRLKGEFLSGLTSGRALDVTTGWSSGEPESVGPNKNSSNGSALRYPTTASTALVNFMLDACRAANRAGGFALPNNAVQFLKQEIVEAAQEVYREALQFYVNGEGNCEVEGPEKGGQPVEGSSESSDAAVMQMLFDVLALQKFFGNEESGYAISSKTSLKSVEAKIQANVDPIDLAACRKDLYDSVSSYTSRTCILFGTITRSDAGKLTYTKRPMASGGLAATSNLVPLAPQVARFTYLPAPMPSTYSVTSAGTAGLNAKAAIGMLRTEANATSGSAFRKRDLDSSVAEYASKVSESVGRVWKGLF